MLASGNAVPALIIHRERCDRCGLCDLDCSTGALSLLEWGFEFIPALCGNCAGCVDACLNGALELVAGPWDWTRLEEAGWVAVHEGLEEDVFHWRAGADSRHGAGQSPRTGRNSSHLHGRRTGL